MSSETITRNDLVTILNEVLPVSTDSSSIPIASTISEFDSAAHINSADMTAAEVTSFVNGLNMTASKAADYVVEEGTVGDSSYRKWASGIAECWIVTAQDVAIDTSYGSLYQGAWQWDFPITFTASPSVTCGRFKYGSGASWGTVTASSGTYASLKVLDVVSRASGSTVIHAYAIGRWK